MKTNKQIMWKPHHYDAIDEGWAVLCVALCNPKIVSSDEAFAEYDGKPKIHYSWTSEDIRYVEQRRKQGATWGQIGEEFGLTKYGAFNGYKKAKKRMEGNYGEDH